MESIRTSGDIPELTDLHDITIIVARMADRDKYFYTHIGKSHSIKTHDASIEYKMHTVGIVFNNNWLVEKGVLRYEIWVQDIYGGTPWLWKHTNNGITVTHSMPEQIKLKYEHESKSPNGRGGQVKT